MRLNKDQVSIFIDYESKTDQAANGMWFALAGMTADPMLDAYMLFLKYKHILDTKGKGLSEGRLWKRIDDNKDGTYRVTKQVRGIEWISSVPAKVANYLGLVESEKYTGHSLRRTCAQWATDNGMTDTQMQHHFGWKSAAMVVRYARSSEHLKQAMAKSLDIEDKNERSTSEQKTNRHNYDSLPEADQGRQMSTASGSASNSNSTTMEPRNEGDGKDKESEDDDVTYIRSEKKAKIDQTKENEHQRATMSARAAGAASQLNLSASARAAGASSQITLTPTSGEVASPSPRRQQV